MAAAGYPFGEPPGGICYVGLMGTTYAVEGMTCEHCVASVVEEVGAVAGVERVEVDLASGRMVVVGADVDGGAVRAAVDEAGYALSAP